NCTSCHINSSGRDTIHPIKYLQANSSFQTTNTSAVNCTNCHQNTMSGFSTAPRIPTPMNHTTNTYSGAMWNATQSGFWDNTSQQSSCNYCHGTIAYHNSSGLGNITLIKGTNTVRQSLTGGYWCANCHYNGGTPSGKYNYKGNLFNPVPPEIMNLTGSVPAASRDGTGFVNHSGYFSSGFDDNACKICHNNNLNSGATSLNFSHNAGTGIAGGANCTNCHDVGGSAGAGRLINSTAMNNGIHSNLNSGTSSPSGYPSSNFKCWACHGNGSEPGTVHPANYKNPYNCTSCHIQGAGQNLNFTPTSILNVSQHYWNGTSITTAAATSCYVCHNLSEMMLGSFDPDGAGSVYAGTNGGNNSTSHYGRKRTDYPIQGTNDYCNSCHNNSSTVFPFIDSNNKSIRNHSVNSAATPLCANSTCHDSGRIHNSTLNKPSLSLPNSSYCSICHSTKVRHNGTINCTQCHLNTSRSIHPVRYLQNDGSGWNTINTTAVNCTNCHQTLLANFSSAPQIPGILRHSSDPSSGMKWGNYWNNSSALTACYYCHQSQVHRATGLLGNITSVRGSNTYNNAGLANSTWCVNCHYSSASQYNGTILNPVPPEITDSSLNSTDGTAFYNHSNFTGYNDSVCKNCHGAALSGYPETTLNFSHAVSEGGGGPNCISCHDETGTGAPSDKRISSASMKSAVHKNLNSDALNTTAVDPINKACWACHGDGTEPSGHPLNYTNPRRCSNNDCHSLAQSYKAPMIYSHFKDAELNDNQNRVLNYNVTTVDSCEACHSNSLSAESNNLNASVSHYATKDRLIDSINCLYCHLDKDNAQTWGNAIEVNKNRTALIEMNRDIHGRNKFTAREGDFVELGLGYRLKVLGVSKQRGSAAIELYHYDTLVDEGLVNIGQYTYEETMMVDNNVFKTPVIILNVSEMFLADNDTFIQFDGWRIKRVHPENKTTSCYLCHYVVGNDRHKYNVIDKVNEKIYFADILFNSSDIQEYDEQQALKILANKTPRDSFTDIERGSRKSMYEGETWDIGKDLRLTLKDISTNSDSALFLLEIGNKTYQDVVRRDGVLEYEISVSYPGQKQNNITIFRARVPEILQNKPNMVVLTDILAMSPEIRSVRENTSIYGYNASWLWENDTFLTGRIPSSMHAPLLHDGVDGGPNCVSCHTGIELGSHKPVNKDSISSVDDKNKACWACHGDGKEPLRHPISFKYPRNCKSCHVGLDNTFNATRIGDEKHSALENCARCHVENTHKVFRFNVVPGIKDLSISKDEVVKGDKITISATAVAGFNMRIKGAEYHIDYSDKAFSMSALDGSFDGQVEEIIAEIDTSGLKPGTHLISVRAMELENKWGVESSISFKVMESESAVIEPEKGPYQIIVLIATFIVLLWFIWKLLIKQYFAH
ncbi:MAG: hypothetical protein PHH85_01780, partial [Candidatus Methanoperedens sp.]|nr:hypothetical protein [Candidatus Methanoperedens sp.]